MAAGDQNFVVKNGLQVNTLFIANNSQFSLGSNVVATTSKITVSNTTGNVVVNSSAVFVGNSTANVIVTPTTVSIIGPSTNLVINSSSLFIGNGSVNSIINSTAATIFGVNTAASYTWTNTHTYSNPAIFNSTANLNSTTNISGAATFTGTVSIAGNMLSQTLTDAATVNWNMNSGQIATVTLAGNRTMAAPTNLKQGTYILFILQDAAGSRTMTWNAVFRWPQGIAPVLSPYANWRDMLSFVSDGTYLYGTFVPGFV
jgi:hypothetical protein